MFLHCLFSELSVIALLSLHTEGLLVRQHHCHKAAELPIKGMKLLLHSQPNHVKRMRTCPAAVLIMLVL